MRGRTHRNVPGSHRIGFWARGKVAELVVSSTSATISGLAGRPGLLDSWATGSALGGFVAPTVHN